MTRSCIVLAGFVLLLSLTLDAGELDARFAQKLQAGSPDTLYPAVVSLKSQVDLVDLDRRLTLGNAPRALRHRIVIEALQARAKATQAPVLARLRTLEEAGQVRGIKPLWITNAVLVEAKPAALRWLSTFSDVGQVLDGGVAMTYPTPRNITPGNPFLDAPTPGLLLIKADKVWAKGINGAGTVVANIDTGVDASHPALGLKWRGLKVPANQAWYDPVNRTKIPNDKPFPQGGHGTHTMGTLCGDDGKGKQIGVAPGATWIAVGLGNSPAMPSQMLLLFLQSLQWIADPDGSPGTVADAPDVVSNSWGFTPGFPPPPFGVAACDKTVWPGMDACEAAGTALVFSAGNDGQMGPGTISVPSDRITTPTNAYAVGAVNQDGKTLAVFSSRGPSGCDRQTIKPEVSAPGVQVESSLPGGYYSKQSGTSMASPHVGGAIALLRQVNPDISPTRVKEILMETAVDLGATGEDNSFGHGLIDVEAAYQKVLAERGVAQVSLVTTTPTPKRPDLFWLHLSATNFTAQPQRVWFQIDLLLNGKPFANLIPPIAPVLPPNFSLSQGPAVILIPVPAILPANLVGVPFTFRATLKQNAKEISRADAGFVIQ